MQPMGIACIVWVTKTFELISGPPMTFPSSNPGRKDLNESGILWGLNRRHNCWVKKTCASFFLSVKIQFLVLSLKKFFHLRYAHLLCTTYLRMRTQIWGICRYVKPRLFRLFIRSDRTLVIEVFFNWFRSYTEPILDFQRLLVFFYWTPMGVVLSGGLKLWITRPVLTVTIS